MGYVALPQERSKRAGRRGLPFPDRNENPAKA